MRKKRVGFIIFEIDSFENIFIINIETYLDRALSDDILLAVQL